MKGHRYAPRDTSSGVGANWFEQPDAWHALADYQAAVKDIPPEQRPAFSVDDWRDEYAQPITPAWASDDGGGA